MAKAKVAINGYGTIGKRVADAVACQDDMEVIGIAKTRPNFEAVVAVKRGFDIYTLPESIEKFEKAGIKVAGTIEDMVKKADIVVDCTPGKKGVANAEMYKKYGVKAIWQGGEGKDVAPVSFNSVANYDQAYGADYVRVVSCNTTGLCRVIYPLDKVYGVKKVRVTLIRRGGDPGDIKSGPIDGLILDPVTLPSHHGPDVNTIIPHINITSAAIKAPTTFMHVHVINMELEKECTADDVRLVLGGQSRINLIDDGITGTNQIIEYGRDLCRPRNDMPENCVFKQSISVSDGELYMFQAIHQESDVIPENVDCIRAMLKLEPSNVVSINKTNKAMGIGFCEQKPL